MPPAPPPAPVKEKLADTRKRPIRVSRADTALYSDQRPAVSAAPAEIPVVTITSSLRNRGPTTKASQQLLPALVGVRVP